MKKARLPLQVITISLQLYFFIEMIRLFFGEYIFYMWDSANSDPESAITTLAVVALCEVISLVEVIFFIISKHSAYSYIYLALLIINAVCFIALLGYSTVGNMICFSLYLIIFILRVVNLVLNTVEVSRMGKECC